jgi:hypothetical protein
VRVRHPEGPPEAGWEAGEDLPLAVSVEIGRIFEDGLGVPSPQVHCALNGNALVVEVRTRHGGPLPLSVMSQQERTNCREKIFRAVERLAGRPVSEYIFDHVDGNDSAMGTFVLRAHP